MEPFNDTTRLSDRRTCSVCGRDYDETTGADGCPRGCGRPRSPLGNFLIGMAREQARIVREGVDSPLTSERPGSHNDPDREDE